MQNYLTVITTVHQAVGELELGLIEMKEVAEALHLIVLMKMFLIPLALLLTESLELL